MREAKNDSPMMRVNNVLDQSFDVSLLDSEDQYELDILQSMV